MVRAFGHSPSNKDSLGSSSSSEKVIVYGLWASPSLTIAHHHRLVLRHLDGTELMPFFGTHSQKTSVSLLILLTHLLISPILRPHSPLLHSTHDWKPNSLSYPIPVPLLHRHMSAIITDCNRSTMLSPRFDLPGFWPGTETRSLAIADWIWYSAVNKLVSLTWLLWALRSFRSFTLHYFT